MENFQSFLDATPDKGVIIVEYYWQSPATGSSTVKRVGMAVGANTSMVFFRRIRASDDCWCGSKHRFARCHRRDDDWTYVTLDPDQGAYSPVVLLERAFSLTNSALLGRTLESEKGLLRVDQSDSLSAWGVPIEPPVVDEIGQLILGTIAFGRLQFHVETNSEKRFAFLLSRVQALLGDSLGDGATFRAEPQKAFPHPAHLKRRKKEGR